MNSLQEYFDKSGLQEQGTLIPAPVPVNNQSSPQRPSFPDPRTLPHYARADQISRRAPLFQADRELWGRLLYLAEEEGKREFGEAEGIDFAQNLMCFRLEGTRIVENVNGRSPASGAVNYKLEPVILSSDEILRGAAGWRSLEEFRGWAGRYLGARKEGMELLRKLLQNLGNQEVT